MCKTTNISENIGNVIKKRRRKRVTNDMETNVNRFTTYSIVFANSMQFDAIAQVGSGCAEPVLSSKQENQIVIAYNLLCR